MGKSIRSKIKKRLRTVKRERVDAMIITPRENEHNQALHRVMEGRAVTLSRPKNAFKYPSSDGAVFPQHEVIKPIDFRAQNLPMAGYVFRGNRRKYVGEQKDYMENKKKEHPNMEVMAGGGAVLARDGRRISMHEAEILATAASGRPEAAAQAVSSAAIAAAAGVRAASSSARIATDSHGDAEMGGNAEVEHPKGEADHSRRPIVKDTRRIARTAELQPRRISAKKKAKGKRQAEALGFSVDNEDDDDDEAEPAVVSSPAPANVAKDAASPSVSPNKVKKKLKKKASPGKAAMDED